MQNIIAEYKNNTLKDGGEDCSWMPYMRQPTYLWWIVDFSDFAFGVCPLGKN